MRLFLSAVVLIVFLGSTDTIIAGELCRTCIRDAVKDMKEKVVATAILGAIGGLKVNSFTGAICGAVIGAVGQSVNKLIEVSKCEKTCREEALAERDPDAKKCDALLTARSR